MRDFRLLFRSLFWPCRWLFVACLSMPGLVNTANAAAVSGQGTWETTLQGRDLDGNLATFEAYYDTVLNITWLADANYSQTTGFDADGRINWSIANAWAAALNPYGSGIFGWRLPTTIDADGPDADSLGNDGCSYTNFYQGIDCGYNISVHSEMSHMFYVTLGDKAYYTTSGSYPQTGYGLTNIGPFSNVQAFTYWSTTEFAPDTTDAWYFDFSVGPQNFGNKVYELNAWAVHSGDVGTAVSSVPIPAAAWLFGSGLAGLIGLARCRLLGSG